MPDKVKPDAVLDATTSQAAAAAAAKATVTPETPAVDPEPVTSFTDDPRFKDDPAKLYESYRELEKQYKGDLGNLKGEVTKIQEGFNSFQETFKTSQQDLIGQFDERFQSLVPKETPKPPEPMVDGFPAELQITDDDLIDVQAINRKLAAQRQYIKNELANAQSEHEPVDVNAVVKQQVSEQVQNLQSQALQNQALVEKQELVKQGFNEKMVNAAIHYGIANGAQTVNDAWKMWKDDNKEMFASQKEQSTLLQMAQNREAVHLPQDLGTGVPVDDEAAVQKFLNSFTVDAKDPLSQLR